MWLKSKSGDDDMKNFPNWDQEFQLEPWPEDGLFDEYLEMGKLLIVDIALFLHLINDFFLI